MTPPYRLVTILSRSVLFFPFIWASQAYADDDAFKDEWHGSVGLGVGTIPKYPGADSSRTLAYPVGQLTYNRFFIGGGAGPGVGAYLYRKDHFQVGLGLSYSLISPRQESRDPHLTGLGDVPKTARGSLFAAYNREWFRISGSLSQDIGGKKEGLLMDLGIVGKYRPLPSLELTAGPKLVWGNQEYMQTLFGVTQQQSANSGLAVYTPKSGLTRAELEFGATYELNRDWRVGMRGTVGRLEGDAAKSPITEKKAQNSAGVYFAYKF